MMWRQGSPSLNSVVSGFKPAFVPGPIAFPHQFPSRSSSSGKPHPFAILIVSIPFLHKLIRLSAAVTGTRKSSVFRHTLCAPRTHTSWRNRASGAEEGQLDLYEDVAAVGRQGLFSAGKTESSCLVQPISNARNTVSARSNAR